MNVAPPAIKQCSACGTQFECGAARDNCWCQNLPPLPATLIESAVDCRCPACLADALHTAEAAQLKQQAQ